MKVIYVCIGMLLLHDVGMAATARNVGRPTVARNARRATVSVRTALPVVNNKRQVSRSVVARSGTAQSFELMVKTSDMLNTCKAQYTQCMDNFCNVLDETQGRCSCSKNLKNYAATETALEKATEELQDVAQKIQYIGLSSDEITTLFTQTEAELTMQTGQDTSQLKKELDRIKNLIVDVKSGTASVSSDTGLNLDFTIPNTGFDLSSMFGAGMANTSSISNQRGEQLYKTASSRCKAAVLNSCAAQGVDISLVTNSYDWEIDKQCIAYERRLTDSNTQMISTVRNAKSVLQKARLMVAQQKNQYDMRGCINALDSCMRDDFVCGSDYENCLDPTGKWIVNGKVVAGSAIGTANISDTDIANMLRTKIGSIDGRGVARGMCASVMQKCQNYTMQNGKYDNNNALMTEYIVRTTNIIKKKRQTVINEYASGCLSDVVSCLNTNNQVVGSFSDVAINACSAVITTCKSLTDGSSGSNIKQWLEDFVSVANNNVGNTLYDPVLDTANIQTVRQMDIEKCNSIPGGHVSYSGTLCAVWNASDRAQLFNMATKNGWILLSRFGGGNYQTTSYLVGKDMGDETADLYIMHWAYRDALSECGGLGGQLDFEPGKEHNNAYAHCVITMAPSAMTVTEQQCKNMGTVWPVLGDVSHRQTGTYDAAETVNGVVTKVSCSFIHNGLYYVGADLPGQCLPGLDIVPDIGNCQEM